jgi:hypothetical protein
MRAKGLLIGLLVVCIAGAAGASTSTVPETMTVEIREDHRTRAETIRAILQVCRYLEHAYPRDHKRKDCLELFEKWMPKADR